METPSKAGLGPDHVSEKVDMPSGAPADAGTVRVPIRLFVLGDFRAERLGQVVEPSQWRGRKTRSLVKLLCLQRPHQLHREQVLEILWPDLDSDQGDAAFRKTVHYARKALAGSTDITPIKLRDGTVGLDPIAISVDLDVFESTLQSALRAGDLQEIETAAVSWTGPLLPDDLYEEWAAEARRRVDTLYLNLLREGGRLALESGRLEAGIDLVGRATQLEPSAEDCHRQLMRLYATAGRRAEALAQFEACRKLLASELGAEPDQETADLVEQIRSGALTPVERIESAPGPPELSRAARADISARFPGQEFIGRSRPVQLILGSWRAVSEANKARLLAVRGEAGVGKTRLMTEVAREVESAGGGVLWGGCYQLEGQVPYAPFVEALETYLASLSGPQVAAVARLYLELAALLPSLARLPNLQSNEGSDRSRLFDGVARLLTEISSAGSAPLLLVLDDLHEADAATLSLVHYLARLEGARPWLLAGTFREEGLAAGSPSATLISALVRSNQCREIDLLRLSREETRRLVADQLGGPSGPALEDQIFELALGNPLFSWQLVRSMVESGAAVQVGDEWQLSTADGTAAGGLRTAPVPEQIQALVSRQIDSFAAAARSESASVVLGLASLLGVEFSFETLRAAASGLPQPVAELGVIETLEDAVQAGLLESRGMRFGFRHPLVASATRETISAPRQVLLHRSIAMATEADHPDQVDALAYHFRQAGEKEKALHYLEMAADHAAQTFAHEAAAAQYLEVLDLIRKEGSHLREMPRVKIKYARCLGFLGQNQEASRLLEEAVGALPKSGDSDIRLTALAELALSRLRLGEVNGALELVSEVFQREDLEPSRGAALLDLVHSILLGIVGDFTAAEQRAVQAREIAVQLGSAELQAEADLRLVTCAAMLRGMTEARDLASQGLPFITEHAGLETRMRAIHGVSWAEMMMGNIAAMARYTEQARELAGRIGDRIQVAVETARLAQAAAFMADLPKARNLMEEAEAGLDRSEAQFAMTHLLLYRGQIEMLEGNWDEARDHLSRTQEQALGSHDVEIARTAGFWIAEMDLIMSRLDEARSRLLTVLGDPLPSWEGADVTSKLLLLQLAWAYAGSPEREDAERGLAVAETACEYFRTHEYVMYLAAAERVRGRALIVLGRQEEGLETLERAVEESRSIGYPWAEFSALGTLVFCHQQCGNEEEVARLMARLFRLAHDLGSQGFVPLLEEAWSRANCLGNRVAQA